MNCINSWVGRVEDVGRRFRNKRLEEGMQKERESCVGERLRERGRGRGRGK